MSDNGRSTEPAAGGSVLLRRASSVAHDVHRRQAQLARVVGSDVWVVLISSIAPVALRTLLLVEHGLAIRAVDAHGYLSDLTVSVVVGLIVAAALARLGGRGRLWGAGVFSVFWCVSHMGNYEHVKALGAPLQLTYAQYMRDGAFVSGSAASVSHVAWLVVLVALTAAGLACTPFEPDARRSWQTRLIGVLAVALLNAVWPSDVRALAWRERNFMELLLAPSSAKASGATSGTLPPAFRPNVAPDMDGASPLKPRTGKPNVLLVILEGITGGSIPTIAEEHGITQVAKMPELDAIARQGMYFPTFITNQRQTNRGEFALLCGRLDYLQSGTSRMTEYARDGGDPCLPRVLADHGYRTLYLQSAPLSFMMKDQFMAKAGFQQVRGHDAYPKAYARSGWGVDDRAFFEQSAGFIEDLDQSGGPWFATLLTVGTHHPYTVPADFHADGASDANPHHRAVAYLDKAVSAFIERLRAAHVLDNTLLLITSDESFGVEGYDDLTQLLSYNWGFLVASAPGQEPRAVREPFAQTDVALSIADYVGIPTSAFVGRSVFRKYDSDRKLVFGNTYQRKMYWAGPREVVECDEALEGCQKHLSKGPGLFSAQRSSDRARDEEIEPLREILAFPAHHQSREISGRTPLTLANATVWDPSPDEHGLVFGGQYFTLGAEQELVVTLKATPVGPGAAMVVDTDVFVTGLRYEVYPPTLYSGDTLSLQYVYAPRRAESNVEVRMAARRLKAGTGRLVLHDADMLVRPRTQREGGGKTVVFGIERGQPRDTYFLGSGINREPSQRSFAIAPCVSHRNEREYVAEGCGRNMLLYGPYASVPANRDMKATFEVLSENGKVQLRAELVSDRGSHFFGLSDVISVEKDAGALVTVSGHAQDAAEGVEARLGIIDASEGSRLVIRRAMLEVSAPEK